MSGVLSHPVGVYLAVVTGSLYIISLLNKEINNLTQNRTKNGFIDFKIIFNASAKTIVCENFVQNNGLFHIAVIDQSESRIQQSHVIINSTSCCANVMLMLVPFYDQFFLQKIL